VGSRPGAEAHRLGKLAGVELVGEVPDVRPHLHNARVVVVPLRVARGVQNKVLEAMASGKPVVVSREALEGINASPDVDLLCAATPAKWVRAICGLFSESDRCRDLGRAGRDFVEERYRWSSQLAKLAELPGLGPCLQSTATRANERVAV
jgi:glycosyltransferase involved in cell wall biosynthesis